MKKLFYYILFNLLPVITFAQIFTSIGTGYDTKGAVIGTWALGYNKGIGNFQAEIRPSLTRKVEMNNLLGFRLSVNLINPDEAGLSILPGIGYYRNLHSMDKTDLNVWQYAYTLKSMIEVSENGNLYIEGLYTKKSFQFTAGIHFRFSNRDHPY